MSFAPSISRIEGGGVTEIDVGIGEIGQDPDLMLFREGDDLL